MTPIIEEVARRLYVDGGGAPKDTPWSEYTWDELPDSPVRRDCLVRARYMLDVVVPPVRVAIEALRDKERRALAATDNRFERDRHADVAAAFDGLLAVLRDAEAHDA